MAMPSLEAIHFLVTYRCTWACDHCFVWGSPDQAGTMTLAQLRRVIDEAHALGTVSTVYFEGGEPTLAFPVVVEAARYARERGLAFGVVTNAHFAEAVEDATLWLQPFADLGVSDLSISAYPYTSGGADRSLLRNAVEAALGLGLGDVLTVIEVGGAADLDGLGVAGGTPSEVLFKGRAARALAPEREGRPPAAFESCPSEDLGAPGRCHLGCDGELQLCQGVSAGNVFATSLADVLGAYRAERRPVVRELLAGGPAALAARYGIVPGRDRYADACHLCYELRARLRERVPEVLAPAACYGVGLPELETE